MATTETFIGQPVLRKEDPELLTGHASYIDNWTMPGMVWMGAYGRAIVMSVIDGVVYGLITGAVFAGLWPG